MNMIKYNIIKIIQITLQLIMLKIKNIKFKKKVCNLCV